MEGTMAEHIFDGLEHKFGCLVAAPLPFLQGDPSVSEKFISLCKDIYDFSKASGESSTSTQDPLPKLIIQDFDDEQVWQEIEMLNKPNVAQSLKKIEELVAKKRRIRFRYRKHSPEDFEHIEGEQEEEDSDGDDTADEEDPVKEDKGGSGESSGEEGFHFEESDDDNVQLEAEEFGTEDTTEKTEVDDDFFSLRRMEKFLEEQDQKYEDGTLDADNTEIDYFGEILSDDEDDRNQVHEDSDLSFARHLKYSDYYESPQPTEKKSLPDGNGNDMVNDESDDENADENISLFKKQQAQFAKRIKILEDKMLQPADWQMKGEIKANHRPENSLLQETLTFDHVARPPVEITEEHTKDVESLIKQRILDCAWDDVERKVKPEDPAEFKKRIVLDSSQSKLTLSEIYEKEYLEKKQRGEKDEIEEKESEAHVEIRKQMKDLFRKLDALSNFHFVATPPEPEIKITSNLPSITMEEVQPVTHTDSTTLAPEEVFEKSVGGEEKSAKEKSTTDRKRERRKKKLRMKARAKSKLEKLKKLDPNSAVVKKLDAIKQLKNAAKAPRSNTVVLKQASTRSSEKLTSSQKFFSRLQDQSVVGKSTKRK